MRLGWFMLLPRVVLLCTMLSAPTIAAQKFVYPGNVLPAFEPIDEKSAKQGFKQCQMLITLISLTQGVDLRAKIITGGKISLTTLTIDVAEWSMSNGIPYDSKRRPISSARITSNIFETTPKMRQVDMGDGGLGIVLDAASFGTVLKLVARGDYYLGFTPRSIDDETVYVVRQGVDPKVLAQFQSCLQQM